MYFEKFAFILSWREFAVEIDTLVQRNHNSGLIRGRSRRLRACSFLVFAAARIHGLRSAAFVSDTPAVNQSLGKI